MSRPDLLWDAETALEAWTVNPDGIGAVRHADGARLPEVTERKRLFVKLPARGALAREKGA